MAILVFDLVTGLSSIVIITMLLVAVKANVHKISVSISVMGKAWTVLSSLVTFITDCLSCSPFSLSAFLRKQENSSSCPCHTASPYL